jgi:rubrerythrin
MTLTYQIGEEDGLYKALLAAGVQGRTESAAGQSNDTDGAASDVSRAAWDEDADLPICTACGTQYPAAREDCPICEDDR